MRNRHLLPLLLVSSISCGSNPHNHPQDPGVSALQKEIETDRKLLQETRAELQVLIAELKPFLQMVKMLPQGPDPMDLGLDPTDDVGPPEPASTYTVEEIAREEAAKKTVEKLMEEEVAASERRLKAGIKKTGKNRYRMKKALLDEWLGNPTALSRGLRIVPSIKNGRPVGFKLYAIRAHSPFALLGFENGDTVTRINGREINSPDKGLETYTSIRDAKELKVELLRRGKPVTVVIKIR